MSTAMKVKLAPERQNVNRVWNISDWPGKNLGAQVLVVLGKRIPPGGSLKVPAERLTNAHKLNKDVASGLLFMGLRPPAEYLAAKKPLRVKRSAPPAHAANPKPPKKAAPKKAEKKAEKTNPKKNEGR